MPYVFNDRSSGSHSSFGVVSSGGSSVLNAPTKYEAVYSWRTGVYEVGKETLEEPRSGNSILDVLNARKRGLDREISLASSGAAKAPTHFLNMDMGHEFGSLKYEVSCVPNGGVWRTSSASITLSNILPQFLHSAGKNNTAWTHDRPPDILGGWFRARGSTIVSTTGSNQPITPNDLTSEATRQLSELNPVQSKANVLTSILEIVRGDVPTVLKNLRGHLDSISRWRSQYKTFKDAQKYLGSEFLNVQFGWAPIIRDVGNAISVLTDIDMALFPDEDTRRRSRRLFSVNFYSTNAADSAWTVGIPLALGQTPTSVKPGLMLNSINSGFQVLSGRMYTEYSASTETTVQLSARFFTGLRSGFTGNGYLDRSIDLLGLKLTPEVLWDLTPWTWLLDWFANIGTVLQNLSNLQLSGVILNYAYATTRIKTSYGAWGMPTVAASGTSVWRSVNGHFIVHATADAKVRQAASPFGFALSLDQLNVGQWAILVALGLARQR